MAMNRDEILNRLVAGAAYIEREDITPSQREKAKSRYSELEEELQRMKEEEKEREPLWRPEPKQKVKHVFAPTPEGADKITHSMQNIRDILKKEERRA